MGAATASSPRSYYKKKPKFIRVRRYAAVNMLKFLRCGILRLSRTALEYQLKGKFWVGAKFAF
jgi:hypothetical protein